MTGPRIGSMCTGYGGLDMAVSAVLGGGVSWVADNAPGAAKILAHRFPGIPNLGDITQTNWSRAAAVDVVCAGFPCQDLSYAGRGAGIVKGSRSGLWYYIADALGVLRPRLLVIENVAALVRRRPGLDVVLADLARLGFDAEWVRLRASDIGAAHGRPRVFLLAWASAEDADRAAGHQRGEPASGQAAGGRARPDAGRSGGAPAGVQSVQSFAANADGGGREGVRVAEPAREQSQCGSQPDRRHPDGEFKYTAPSPWGVYEPAIRRWARLTGRVAPPPTEPGRTNERLSPRLVEWMMGLPGGWVTEVPGITRNEMLHALGNGVVPQQAEAALRMLLPAWPGALAA